MENKITITEMNSGDIKIETTGNVSLNYLIGILFRAQKKLSEEISWRGDRKNEE